MGFWEGSEEGKGHDHPGGLLSLKEASTSLRKGGEEAILLSSTHGSSYPDLRGGDFSFRTRKGRVCYHVKRKEGAGRPFWSGAGGEGRRPVAGDEDYLHPLGGNRTSGFLQEEKKERAEGHCLLRPLRAAEEKGVKEKISLNNTTDYFKS